jgi:hypothetical protein
MIDIQIVSYQSRQKLFKIFYNILYSNQCCSPSLALSHRRLVLSQKQTHVASNMLFIRKSGNRPRFPPQIQRGLCHILLDFALCMSSCCSLRHRRRHSPPTVHVKTTAKISSKYDTKLSYPLI